LTVDNEERQNSAAIVRVKFSVDVRVVEGPAIKIERVERSGGGELTKKRGATPGGFATMSLREIKRAVLR
jgi:hypothetical protein